MFDDDYFDIDSIFMMQTRVQVTFNRDSNGLEYMNPNPDGSNKMKAGLKTILPYWIGDALEDDMILTVEKPSTLVGDIQAELQSNPMNVSFEKMPYFYEVGVSLKNKTTVNYYEVFKARLESVVEKSQNWGTEDTNEAIRDMSESEVKMFRNGYESIMDYRNWYNREEQTLKPYFKVK